MEAASECPRPSPPLPTRTQHLQERACALLTRRLTVASHPELEQVDDAESPPPPSSPPPPPPPAESPPPPLGVRAPAPLPATVAAAAPPAVPPKPPQLGALGRLRRRPPARSPPVVGALSPAAVQTNGPGPATPGPAMRPHRQILSNGSLLKAAAAAASAAPSPEAEPAVAVASERAAGACGASVARVRGVGPVAARVQRQLGQQQQQQQMQRQGSAAAIRVGSSVSSLITGAAGGSIVCELARDRHPDSLHSHFEEFHLEDVDIGGDAQRSSAKSSSAAAPAPATAPTVVPCPQPDTTQSSSTHATTASTEDTGSYEGFLEATGLSQKPLLTPSRLLSNHRSMLKPKDVKLRSRARAVAPITGTPPPDRPPPVVRYWVEPFL